MASGRTYSGKGWRLFNISSLAEAPEFVAAPISAIGLLLVSALVVGLAVRASVAIARGNADDVYKILLSLAGVIGAPFVAWRTIVAHQQTTIARESHYTSLFTKAVEQLGATREVKEWKAGTNEGVFQTPSELQTRTEPNLEVRLGAIYALDRIAKDSERDHWPIMEVLCAYARNPQNCGLPLTAADGDGEEEFDWTENIRHPRVDVQAAMTVIGLRSDERIAHEQERRLSLNFSRANLQSIVFNGSFDKALFKQADLVKASFNHSSFSGANFDNATCGDFSVFEQDWEATKFMAAALYGCRFYRTNLDRARFSWAKIKNGGFVGSKLSNSNFYGASLESVSFDKSDLTRANFTSATLQHVSFEAATLVSVTFYKADLRLCSGLTTEQLILAHGDKSTKLPEFVLPPPGWPDTILKSQDRWRAKALTSN